MSSKSEMPACLRPDQQKSWFRLEEFSRSVSQISMRELFDKDPNRAQDFYYECEGLSLDLSRQYLDRNVLKTLLDLAEEMNVPQWKEALFSGAQVNTSENLPALHPLLRMPKDSPDLPQDPDLRKARAAIAKSRDRMEKFARQIYEEGKITDIVNIGIGGSCLGPQMASKALAPYHKKGIKCHFISNIDGHDISQVLSGLDAEKTLFLLASKSFTTEETLINGRAAQNWLARSIPKENAQNHFIALTANSERAQAFGIAPNKIFPIENWVGGRFSLWSSIGLSLYLLIGQENFEDLLCGAAAMDTHFKQAPLDQNMPVLLALCGVWNRNFLDMPALAILPYDQRLERLPAYIQQLDMESSGKSADRNNLPVSYATGPIVFGEPGTNGQHAFYQLLHQGRVSTACEMIGILTPHHDYPDHHKRLISNMLAQASALMFGSQDQDGRKDPQCFFPGNHPSALIWLKKLTPFHLGQLLALYEHKVFVQGILWNINTFDQSGVELGKKIAKNVYKHFYEPERSDLDPATKYQLKKI